MRLACTAARNLLPTSTPICKQSPISTRSAEASSRAFYFSVRMPPYSVRQKSIEGRQKVTKWYGSSGCFWLVPGIYGNGIIFCFAIKSICTKAALVIAHIVQSSLSVLDFLCKLCHTIATGNVPDNVPEYITESEVLRQNAESDHQGHCPDQRLLGEHHFSCHQRPARCK